MSVRSAAQTLTPANAAIAQANGKEVKHMEDTAREARNRYKREWYARNKDKQREYERRYWQRKAQSDGQKSEENGEKEGVKA